MQGLVHGYFTKKTWYSPSFVLDTTFSSEILAGERRIGYKHPLDLMAGPESKCSIYLKRGRVRKKKMQFFGIESFSLKYSDANFKHWQ